MSDDLVKRLRAPVQGYSPGIPWEMHLRAYDAYCKRYSPQRALIEGGCRGGFGTEELDEFIPGWRDELSEIAALLARAEAAEDRAARHEHHIAGLEAQRNALSARLAEVEKERDEANDRANEADAAASEWEVHAHEATAERDRWKRLAEEARARGFRQGMSFAAEEADSAGDFKAADAIRAALTDAQEQETDECPRCHSVGGFGCYECIPRPGGTP